MTLSDAKKNIHEALDNLRADQVVTVHFISFHLFPKLEKLKKVRI